MSRRFLEDIPIGSAAADLYFDVTNQWSHHARLVTISHGGNIQSRPISHKVGTYEYLESTNISVPLTDPRTVNCMLLYKFEQILNRLRPRAEYAIGTNLNDHIVVIAKLLPITYRVSIPSLTPLSNPTGLITEYSIE